MKRLLSVLIAVAMMMAFVIPAFAEDGLNIYEGESTSVTVSWNETSLVFTPGSDPLTVLISETGIISVNRTGISVGTHSSMTYQVTGLKPGTVQLVFRHTQTGATVATYSVTVEKSPYKSIKTAVAPERGGTITPSMDTAKPGDHVNFTVVPTVGCKLESVAVTDAENKVVAFEYVEAKDIYGFTMPNSEVTIKADFSGTPLYPIKLEYNEDMGKATLSKEAAAPGEKITVDIVPVKGCILDPVTIKTDSGADVEYKLSQDSSKLEFTMPESAVDIQMSFSGRPYETREIKILTEGQKGTVVASKKSADPGETITYKTTPDYGNAVVRTYVSDDRTQPLELTTVKEGQEYSFVMPNSEVTIYVQFGYASSPNFSDVTKGLWYWKGISYCYDKGYMAGVGDNQFGVNMSVTRAMVAQILYATEGKPAAKASQFTDVAAGQWYTDAIGWAAANKLVSGYWNGKFGPNDSVTREQLSAILYQYTKFKGFKYSTSGDLSKFKDANEISSWAKEPMQWAVANALLSGVGDGGISPKGRATRAQVATILLAYDTNIRK